MNDDRELRSHPSYAMVRFSRVTGGESRLFGSPVAKHGDSIVLTISRAVEEHSLGESRYYARKELIEVELSAAQFATLLTTVSFGSGVPGTLKRLQGEAVEKPPIVELEHERVAKDLAEEGEPAQKIRKAVEDLEALLLKIETGVPKRDQKLLLADAQRALRTVKTQLGSNLPFIFSQFREAAERVKTAVYAEAEAWMTNAVARAGFKALREEVPRYEAPLLPQDEDEQG